MSGLPAPLAEPLHILEPWPWRAVLLTVVVGCLALAWVRYWLRNRPLHSEPPPLLSIASEPSAFAAAVEAIRERGRESSFFRLGCHELVELVRGVMVVRHGAEFERLTARETALRLDGDQFAELLVQAAAVRFGRRVPDEAALNALCDLALEVDGRGSR